MSYEVYMVGLVEQAFQELFPGEEFDFSSSVSYSGRFKGFNANVMLRGKHLEFRLSKQWRGVSKDIQMGLVQSLLVRILGKVGKSAGSRRALKTLNMELYDIFLKQVHVAVPKTKCDPLLLASFQRVNEAYFHGLMDVPNLVWGQGVNKLGSYEYGTDTVSISYILEGSEELLDYVMYHELLHKKHKFSSAGSRVCHHSKAFREDEAKFKGAARLERELGALVGRHKRRGGVKRKRKKPKNFFLDLFGL